ncbi:protein I'm not dead yet 2-like isoform X2 [Scaptodrosophila lebanonensis]|uniref:Protein I'm not dead yet 2-like isoform X2 n=1 Tax=Drosophila lebanonensis TaxID=7225 RepID=A0A6J2TET0_DROLE|nr:protein I'm not dead yet 2-like isoform X2 [Scaptodrosophila lebanonensis]
MEEPEKLSFGKSLGHCCIHHWEGKASILIPLALAPLLIYAYRIDSAAYKCLFLVVVMAVFWITECIPLYMTALLPIVFLPFFGILDSDTTCGLYFSDTLVMFLGGLFLALAIEYSNLHQRIALGTILIVGCSPRRLHLGLILVSAFISMWISNSAATAMMCPIVKAVLNEMETQEIFEVYMTQEEEPVEEGENPHPSKMAMAFYFGIAYASTIGGCGTLVGTGTNLTFKGLYDTRFPMSTEHVDFPIFMAYAIPLVVVANTILLYISLQVTHMGLFRPNSKIGQEVKRGTVNKAILHAVVKERYKELGAMTCHEIQLTILFSMMIFLLFTRQPGFIKGWGDFLNATSVGSSSPLMLPLILCFALPTQYTFFRYCFGSAPFPGRAMDALLSWVFVDKHTPFGLAFLLGGGFALAEGSTVSGMAKMLADVMGFAENMPGLVIQGVATFLSIFCTAFGSNVAVCNVLIPILSEVSLKIKMHPLKLTLPSALAMSMAYHLPVSTPPNAIISGYAGIKTKYMAVAGILPTIWGFAMVLLNATTWGIVVFPATKSFPDWAKEAQH